MTKKKLWTYMPMASSIVVVAIAAFTLVSAYGNYGTPPKVVVEGNYIEAQGQTSPISELNIGALSSPDLPYDWFSVGGSKETRVFTTMNLATTTPCAMQSPRATSSLVFAAFDFAPASSTAAVSMVIAKDSTAFATTTAIGSKITIPSGLHRTIVASSTALGTVDSTDNIVFEPNYYLVMSMQGAGNGTVLGSPVGKCTAIWRVLSQN